MTFLRRGPAFRVVNRAHRCNLPKYRWLPFLIWPRWREGALWMCGYNDDTNNAIYGGCRKVYEWTVRSWCPQLFKCSGCRTKRAWVYSHTADSEGVTLG